jgi:hypothetical protein
MRNRLRENAPELANVAGSGHGRADGRNNHPSTLGTPPACNRLMWDSRERGDAG